MAAQHGNPLHDLELLMDHNIRTASLNAARRPPLPQARHGLCKPINDPAPQSEPRPIIPPSAELHGLPPPTNAPSPVLLPAAASLSLALGSVLSSNLLISKGGLRNFPYSRVSPNPPAEAARVVPTLPSQKKCISPIPVMPAITAAVGVDLPTSPSVLGSKKDAKSTTAFPDYLTLPDKVRKSSEPSNGAAMRKASIVWFRNDLRVHDNEALSTASKESLSILPVYCFDPRDYGKSSSGFDKTGPYRAKFLLECVSSLRENLRERGSDLIVRVGKPEEVLVTLAKSIGADAIYAHQEVSYDEIQSEKKVAVVLKEEGVDVKYFWGSTLFHIEDLPFKLPQMPTTYSGFREQVQNLKVRESIEAPKRVKVLPVRGGVKPGDIPTLQELGLKPSSAQHQEGQGAGRTSLIGGEAEALQRLKSFSLEHLNKSSGKAVKDGYGDSLYGANFSCKISPWLAMGCLSPRRMFEDLKREGRGVASASVSGSTTDDNGMNWLVFELLWRDFFRFVTRKYGSGKKGADVLPATACTGAVPAY